MNIAEVMGMVVADCKADADAIDGKPFTGRSVGESFGSTLAMVSAVAQAVLQLDEQIKARP